MTVQLSILWIKLGGGEGSRGDLVTFVGHGDNAPRLDGFKWNIPSSFFFITAVNINTLSKTNARRAKHKCDCCVRFLISILKH